MQGYNEAANLVGELLLKVCDIGYTWTHTHTYTHTHAHTHTHMHASMHTHTQLTCRYVKHVLYHLHSACNQEFIVLNSLGVTTR